MICASIVDFKPIIGVDPIQDNAVWIVAALDGEIFYAINSARVQNALNCTFFSISIPN
jgi:hypothetical protein